MHNQILKALMDTKEEYSISALSHPNKCDAFEYGTHVGVLRGIELAIGKLTELLNKEENNEF